MANLNIGASLGTVTTLASLPVDKGTIYATLSAASNLSLAAAMYQGQKLNIVINPTADVAIPIPTTTGWYSTFGDTLQLITNIKQCVIITCIGSGQYLISATQDENAKYAGYDYVDLGLPSGIKWATCNVGASQPNEYGKYFQWGATEGYYSGSTAAAHSTWSTHPFNNGSTKENETYWNSVSGTVCPNYTLALQYDAARANMGGGWRMPTSADTKELYDNTTHQWRGKYMELISKNNSNSIVIPASGKYSSGNNSLTGSTGTLWTSTKYRNSSYGTYGWNVSASGFVDGIGSCERCDGYTVRGVIAP